jgi:hypothetical protein
MKNHVLFSWFESGKTGLDQDVFLEKQALPSKS